MAGYSNALISLFISSIGLYVVMERKLLFLAEAEEYVVYIDI